MYFKKCEKIKEGGAPIFVVLPQAQNYLARPPPTGHRT